MLKSEWWDGRIPVYQVYLTAPICRAPLAVLISGRVSADSGAAMQQQQQQQQQQSLLQKLRVGESTLP